MNNEHEINKELVPEEIKVGCEIIKRRIEDVSQRYILARELVEEHNFNYLTKELWLNDVKELIYEKKEYETKKEKVKYWIREDGKVFFDTKIKMKIENLIKKLSKTEGEYLNFWSKICKMIDYENVEAENKYNVYKWILEETGI